MQRLEKLEDVVMELLTKYETLRDDDFLLVSGVLSKYNGCNNLSFREIARKHNELGIPSFESITRCRRKVQADNPNLRGKAKDSRDELQQVYECYALDKQYQEPQHHIPITLFETMKGEGK